MKTECKREGTLAPTHGDFPMALTPNGVVEGGALDSNVQLASSARDESYIRGATSKPTLPRIQGFVEGHLRLRLARIDGKPLLLEDYIVALWCTFKPLETVVSSVPLSSVTEYFQGIRTTAVWLAVVSSFSADDIELCFRRGALIDAQRSESGKAIFSVRTDADGVAHVRPTDDFSSACARLVFLGVSAEVSKRTRRRSNAKEVARNPRHARDNTGVPKLGGNSGSVSKRESIASRQGKKPRPPPKRKRVLERSNPSSSERLSVNSPIRRNRAEGRPAVEATNPFASTPVANAILDPKCDKMPLSAASATVVRAATRKLLARLVAAHLVQYDEDCEDEYLLLQQSMFELFTTTGICGEVIIGDDAMAPAVFVRTVVDFLEERNMCKAGYLVLLRKFTVALN